jgi:hypothetical protein
MDTRLDRVKNSVAHFFYEELMGNCLGLSLPAVIHIERFRLALMTFYSAKYGCWPPNQFREAGFYQSMLETLLADFQNLYQYLVDVQRTLDTVENDVGRGEGIHVVESIQAFTPGTNTRRFPSL